MLQYLHVKNLALIDEIEVEFGRGLNILLERPVPGSRSFLARSILLLAGDTRKISSDRERDTDW